MLTKDEMYFLYRDLMTGLEIGQKAEMGLYDSEINLFGCVSFDGVEREYHISDNEAKLYDYLETAVLYDRYPTTIEFLRFKKSIPKGMREFIEVELKRNMAVKMESKYEVGFMKELYALSNSIESNKAFTTLNYYMDRLENTFNREQFDLFEATLLWAMNHKKLNKAGYAYLLNRVNEERLGIAEDVLPQDIFHQPFFAIAYNDNGENKYFCDARKEAVYAKKYNIEQGGGLVTPIISHDCYYNYEYTKSAAKRGFVEKLPRIFNEEYFRLLRTLKEIPAPMDADVFQNVVNGIAERYGEEAKIILQNYGYRWDVF